MTGTYVYAVIPTAERGFFEVAGVDDDHDEVYTLPDGDIAAVVSASPLADYRGLKRDQAVRYLLAHQQVVETVMRDFAVLPARFGTVLPDESWVHRFLVQGGDLLRATLARLAGRVQMEVVVLWNLQEVFREIGQEAHIAQLKAEIAGRPPEETLVERVAVGQMVQAALEQRRTGLRAHLLDALRELALDLALNPAMDDSMVVNVALLLDQANRQALEWQLELLDKEFEGRLLFRCVGPLPAYSFATVDVQLPAFETVDAARRLLGLGETVPAGEIKRAYHRLAGQLHPDHNHQDPAAEARMTELAQAYHLLTSYADGQAVCRFDRPTVEQTLLIAIRRQEMPA
jgi:hypothetical protein